MTTRQRFGVAVAGGALLAAGALAMTGTTPTISLVMAGVGLFIAIF